MAKLGSSKVRPKVEDTEFDLIFELDSLSSLHIDALGLHGVGAIYMHVTLPSSIYGGRHRPSVEFSMGYTSRAHSQLSRGRTQEWQDKVLCQLDKLCKAFFAAYWPCRTQRDTLSFLVRLYRYVKAKIPKLGDSCIVCGRQQEHTGLKPVPCKLKACKLAFEEHGIGADLKDIYNRPVIADLLITLARAASQCIGRRDSLFQSLPSNLCQKGSNGALSHQQIKWQCMKNALEGIPAIAIMAQKPDLQKFFLGRSMVAETGTSEFSLLRSVLNSCQGHLMQLKPADRFPTMETEYQFRLCMDSPFKEAAFARLKKKHGSQFLFHGSSIYNWHCILREGLKNLSHTGMMTNGASWGSGIYLAECSSLSAAYSKRCSPGVCKSSSIFGTTPSCIALCEVIKHSFNSQTSAPGLQMRVVPDSDRVITRYLFVYSDAIPEIKASSLKETCKRHAKTQTDTLERVNKDFNRK